jgi:cell division septum initiation protein DivIVA
VHFSSEDPEFPASQLNTVHPTTKGWQSLRFCNYPQELGFEMADGYVNIHQIQVLNHQANISSKIEIYIGSGESYDSATWKRLGYMSIDSNEKSNYQARELKTVFVDSLGQYLKLILNQNHPNHLNMYNQVGIIALNLTGAPSSAESKAIPAPPVARINPSKPQSKNIYSDISADLNLDPHTANKLRQLAEAKSKAIESEDYSMAKQIKSVEQELRALGSRLAQLDLAKAEAVSMEDYDLAKDIKEQCDDLRKDIDKKIRTMEIPGLRLTTPAGSSSAAAAAQPKSHHHNNNKPSKFPALNSKDDYPEEDSELNIVRKPPAFMNVDDMVVGGKKVAKVESLNYGDDDHHRGGGGGGDQYGMDGGEEEYDDNFVYGDDRPIKPKAQMDYNDRDPNNNDNINNSNNNNDGGDAMGTGMPVETFPVGEHPLEGVKGFLDLPTPEQLTIKSR